MSQRLFMLKRSVEKFYVMLICLCILLIKLHLTLEPPRGKTNNVVSDQVRHKPTCTVTEKS